jgi:hypothetical protein
LALFLIIYPDSWQVREHKNVEKHTYHDKPLAASSSIYFPQFGNLFDRIIGEEYLPELN